MKVTRYAPSMREAWDTFVRDSKNGTFIIERGYMDYHAEIFADHSLLFHGGDGELLALLPANEADGVLTSHGGLTYGGMVSGHRMTTPAMLEAFEGLLAHMHSAGLARLLYKTVPHIYHAHPAEEDRYALFRCGARLYRSDVLAVALPRNPLGYQQRRVRKVKQAVKEGLTTVTSRDFAAFWPILEANLGVVHGKRPVHSLAEIELLAGRFPDNVRLHLALDGAIPVAGVVIYDSGRVAHVQYIGSVERGREVGALDLIFTTLIERDYAMREYFDFGISNEDDGRVLNVGLIEQKEGFGARAVAHDFYEMALA